VNSVAKLESSINQCVARRPKPAKKVRKFCFRIGSAVSSRRSRKIKPPTGACRLMKRCKVEVSPALRPLCMEARSPLRPLTLSLSPITCCDQHLTNSRLYTRNT